MCKDLKSLASQARPWTKHYSSKALHGALPEKTLYEYLWEKNKEHVSDIALLYYGRKITYNELFRNIHCAAARFTELGIGSGDVVLFCTLNTPEMVYCTYGLNMLGAIVDFEYPTLSDQEMCSALKRTGAKAFVLLDVFSERYSEAKRSVAHVLEISPADSMPLPLRALYSIKERKRTDSSSLNLKSVHITPNIDVRPYCPNQPAIIVHTGGSTGVPKGVLLSNDSFNAVAWQYEMSGMNYSRGDRMLHCIPPFHAYGFSVGVHVPLSLGMTICMNVKIDNQTIVEQFAKLRPNHFIGAGPHVAALMEDKRIADLDFPQLKTIAIGGAATNEVQEDHVNRFLKAHKSNSTLIIGFGMTETCATVCTNMNHCYRVGSVGIPLPKVNVKIVDLESGEELSYNQTGELYISTPSRMLKYIDNEEETHKTLIQESETVWLRTGDLASIDVDGFVSIKGRLKRVCTTRDLQTGFVFKLYPDNVERVIGAIPGVVECSVITVPDAKRINIATAFVVRTDASLSPKTILAYCQENLPAQMIPDTVFFVKALPRNTLGKIEYAHLKEMYYELRGGNQNAQK